MEEAYNLVSVAHYKPINPRPSTPPTSGPSRSESRFHGAVVVFLGLLSFFLLVGLISLGVRYYYSVQRSTTEFSAQANIAEHLQTSENKISSLTRERDLLNDKLTDVQANLTKHLQTSENKISSLTQDRDLLNAKLTDVQANLTKRLQNSENKISSLTEDRDLLNAKLTDVQANLTKHLQTSENEISSLTQDRDLLNAKLTDVQANLTKHLQTNDNKISSLSRMKDLLNAKLTDVQANLTNRLQTSENKISSLTQERDLLNAKLTETREELKKLQYRSCPEGWRMFLSGCYFLSNMSGSWDEARQDCNNMDADLVVIDSPEEQKFVSNISTGAVRVWIGLSDKANEGTWTWINNAPLSLQYWRKGEPNNTGQEEDCAEIGPSSQKFMNWNDAPCNTGLKWVCEKGLM